MSDLISRQAAITIPIPPKWNRKYLTTNLDDAYELGWDDCQKCVEALPAAQPEIEERMSETEQNVPNDDFISRKGAIDALMEDFKRIPTNAIRAKTVIEQLPSAQPERQRGAWIEYIPEHGKCPFCGNQVDLLNGKANNFCGECGADMRGEQDG